MATDDPTTLSLTLNGEPRPLPGPVSLAAALDAWGYTHRGFAVAVNREFVPRSAYADRMLDAGDDVEVVAPMAGG